MTNYYKLTPKNLRNKTQRLRSLSLRFRASSFKYSRQLKYDLNYRFLHKKEEVLNVGPSYLLKKKIVNKRIPWNVYRFPRYMQRKMVPRPNISFDSANLNFIYFANRAKKQLQFFSNFCRTPRPFTAFQYINKKKHIFIVKNTTLIGKKQKNLDRFFCNFTNLKPKLSSKSLDVFRFVYKSEYYRDLIGIKKFPIYKQNNRVLGVYKYHYTTGSTSLVEKALSISKTPCATSYEVGSVEESRLSFSLIKKFMQIQKQGRRIKYKLLQKKKNEKLQKKKSNTERKY